MSKPIDPMPLRDLQGIVGSHIEHVRDNARLLHIWLSVAEYLKDARRWHYAEGHTLPELGNKELRDFVDAEIESDKIDT